MLCVVIGLLLIGASRAGVAEDEFPHGAVVWSKYQVVWDLINDPLAVNADDSIDEMDEEELRDAQERAFAYLFTNIENSSSELELEKANGLAQSYFALLQWQFGPALIPTIVAPVQAAIRGTFSPGA